MQGRRVKKKDMRKVKYFACHKTSHYPSQCPNKKKKGKNETQTIASIEIKDFVEKFEKEFSLVSCLLCGGHAGFEDIGEWVVDSHAYSHMRGMSSVFLNLSLKTIF